jgi:hypothetical protein
VEHGVAVSGPAAVFRADTTSDVITASIVARRVASARAILLLSSDWASGEPVGYVDALRQMARLHAWERVLTIPPLPVNRANPFGMKRPSRAEALRATKATASALTSLVGRLEMDPGDVNDVYVTCLHHEDVRMLAAAFPWASVNYYPHSFVSLTAPELDYYAPFVDGRTSPQSLRDSIVDSAKRLAFGSRAVPIRHVRVERAFTFGHRAAWAQATVDIGDGLNEELLAGFFDHLPDDVRGYVASLQRPGVSPALLVLAHDDLFRDRRPMELQSYRQLVELMASRHGADLTLVKPHPRSDPSHAREVAAGLAREIPGMELVTVDAHTAFPVELLTARMNLAAAAGIGSTALKVLRMVRDIPTYSATEAWLAVVESDAGARLRAQQWLEDCRGYVTPVP